MKNHFATPQDAEDAFYDAIDERDAAAMLAVWEESDEIICLLPMMPVLKGRDAVAQSWRGMLGSEMRFEMEIKHLSWIESTDIAIHFVEEHVATPGQPGKQVVYATNIYRKGADGWRILLHQNSPTPPPDLRIPD